MKILVRRLIRSSLMRISTVCICISEFTQCSKLPSFTLVVITIFRYLNEWIVLVMYGIFVYKCVFFLSKSSVNKLSQFDSDRCYILDFTISRFTLCMLGNFTWFLLLSVVAFFSKLTFQNILSDTLSEYLRDCQTRTGVLLVLIWAQTVCKCYHKMTNIMARIKWVN